VYDGVLVKQLVILFFTDRRDLVRVEATVLEKTKGPKKIVFKMKRRKGYRKWKGVYTM